MPFVFHTSGSFLEEVWRAIPFPAAVSSLPSRPHAGLALYLSEPLLGLAQTPESLRARV